MRKNSFTVLLICFSVLFLGVIARLGWLMLIEGEDLAALAYAQQARTFSYYQYDRGQICDRNGRSLTDVTEHCAVVYPAMLEDVDTFSAELAEILGVEESLLQERIQISEEQGEAACILKTGLSNEQAEQILAADIPGVTALVLSARYAASTPAVHLLGSCRWQDGDWHGISGLEALYDETLLERDSRRLLAYVDATGAISRDTLYWAEEEKEDSYAVLQLTLDLDLQQVVEQVFQELGYTGACVVMDPQNGDVLALVSAPSYDPYFWEEGEEGAYVNKAFSVFPPASTFKTVLAAAALSEGVSLPDSADAEHPGQFFCTGSYALADGHTVYCTSAEDGHGWLDLASAMECSCNCYFVALGQTLGEETIVKYAEKLGYTRAELLGYDNLSTRSQLTFDGNIPAAVANASLGEEGILVSPLQQATAFCTYVNGGYLVTPRLVQQLTDAEGKVVEAYSSAPLRRVLDKEIAESIYQMLVETVRSGTAQGAQSSSMTAGGKTGTSESGAVWFCGFAPAENPEYVIAVCVENGSAGGVEAAAVFRGILEGISRFS